MNRTKLFALLIALVLLLLAGCGASNAVPETTVATNSLVVEETTVPTESGLLQPQNHLGMDYYSVCDGLYPAVLGAPELTQEEVDELYGIRLERIKDKINTVGDAFYYLNNLKESQPGSYVLTLAKLISGDYDDIGMIEYWMEKNYYSLLYVKQDGMYYALDPFFFGTRPDGRKAYNWLCQTENTCADEDLQMLAEKVYEALPVKGMSLISIDISGDPTRPHGAEVISPHGAAYPAALGQPVLSTKQIKELIAEGDYEKIAANINTVGDAINFCLTSKIQFYDARNNNAKDNLNYVQSAWQVLKSNEGQCVSMSNLFHYLLEGDYEEVGYVNLRSSNSGHVVNYILHDGMYYLINPVDYTYPHAPDWFGDYPNPLICCAEDFQTIADSIVQHMPLEDDVLTDTVHLVKSPGDCVQGYRGKYYPIGCEVIPYYGEQDITYIEAGYEWDTQTRIDY